MSRQVEFTSISFAMSVLVLCLLLAYYLRSRRVAWLPEASAFLLVGMLCGAILKTTMRGVGLLDELKTGTTAPTGAPTPRTNATGAPTTFTAVPSPAPGAPSETLHGVERLMAFDSDRPVQLMDGTTEEEAVVFPDAKSEDLGGRGFDEL